MFADEYAARLESRINHS